jgi:hypothetical protein
MKPILLFFSLFFAAQSLVAQSFVLDFKMKKTYGDPFVFNDSAAQKTYFVFIRKEGFTQKASLCIIETDSVFNILRQSETNCGAWDGDIVFQEINPTNLILYIVETNTTLKPSLAKLQINRNTLTYYFDKVVSLNMGEDLSYLRGLSDGKKHYIINVLRAAKADSLLVLTINNGVSQGIQRYLLPDLSDIKETWKKIFKDKYVLFGPTHPLLVINPTDNPAISLGVSDNKLYLANDELIFTMKYDLVFSKMERIIKVNCKNQTITTEDITFRKPKALEDYSSNDPISTASFITDKYLFQAWTNGKTGVLVARTVDSLKEKRRWEFGEQDTFGFKNSPVYHHLENQSYWFADKKKPFKNSKELLTKMMDDGFLLAARKDGNEIKMQFGTYKYVDQSNKRIGVSVGFGLIGGLVASVALPNYERATYFWLSLNSDDLSQKNTILSDDFDIACERIRAIPRVKILNYFSVNGHRAILYQRGESETFDNSIVRYYLKLEEK